MHSIPLSAVVLQINIKELAKNIPLIKEFSDEQRNIIFEKAKKQIAYLTEPINDLADSLCDEREFCQEIGVNYNNLMQKDYNLIKCAIEHYILKNKADKEKQNF